MTKFDIPKEQYAQVFTKFGSPAEYKKIPVATPGPDELLVNVKYSGVCHSDVHAMKGDWPVQSKLPIVGGHEGAGVVVAKGELVPDDAFALGDHVGIKWINGVCTKCSFCKQAREELCPSALISGYTVNGSYQQYAIAKAAATSKIPKELDLAGVSPIMCAGLTVYKGLKECGARPGQYVAIIGAGGGLGSMAVQYAKAMGFIPIAVDGGEEKGRSCKALGAETYIDFTKSRSVVEDLKKATRDELGAHAAIIVSSEEEPFSHASEFVRALGTVVILGIPTDGYVKTQIWDTIARDITIKGTLVGNLIDADEAIDFFRRGLINIPYQVVGMSKLNEIISALDRDGVIGRYVVDTSA